MISNERIYTDDEALDYIGKWKEGGLDRLKAFKFTKADYQWMLFRFGGIQWAQGPRFYETEDGEKIDCSQGIDWIREDERVGTLLFTLDAIKEDPMETEQTARRTALFLVWP